MNQIRAYVAHSICGKMGKDATDEYMKANNDKAILFGKNLRYHFRSIDFYVPGDHDEFVMIAYRKKLISIPDILVVDCEIINRCNFLIAYSPDGFISNGMQVEIDYAITHDVPVLVVRSSAGKGLAAIHRYLEGLKT